jgi:dimethylhistidine N-methyltransferase
MTTIALPQISAQTESPVASAVREGLSRRHKSLPAWLFYDDDGSRLFDQITELPEYYLTRTERGIFAARADEIIARASLGECEGEPPARLRITELGAGSADKTRLLLAAAARRQGTVLYEPIDVCGAALDDAQARIQREIPGVEVVPIVMDYTQGLDLEAVEPGERRMVLYIGSSIGNFEPARAEELLQGVRAALEPGDTLLLGVDLRKEEATLLAAYDDAAGVTARFNLNMLARLNRELGADFDLEAFAHRAVWNPAESRIEMHLESLTGQTVSIASLDLEVDFAAGERIHTENSYKYAPGGPQAMLAAAGFATESVWTDERGWFAVCLARAV